MALLVGRLLYLLQAVLTTPRFLAWRLRVRGVSIIVFVWKPGRDWRQFVENNVLPRLPASIMYAVRRDVDGMDRQLPLAVRIAIANAAEEARCRAPYLARITWQPGPERVPVVLALQSVNAALLPLKSRRRKESAASAAAAQVLDDAARSLSAAPAKEPGQATEGPGSHPFR